MTAMTKEGGGVRKKKKQEKKKKEYRKDTKIRLARLFGFGESILSDWFDVTRTDWPHAKGLRGEKRMF